VGRFVSNTINDPLCSALKMVNTIVNTKARTQKARDRGHVAPALVRSANLVITKVGLILAVAFVALAIGMTFYYRTIMSFLLF
jgi:hypothetical protein